MGITSLSQANADPALGLTLIAVSSFSAVASVSVDGCFTASYDNYMIVSNGISVSGTDVVINLRLRAASSDSSAATYAYLSLFSGSTTSNRRSLTGTSFDLGSATTGYLSPLSLTVGQPQLAAQTTIASAGMLNGTSGSFGHFATGVFANTTQFDGFTLYPASGTFTGSLAVYGYRKAL